MHRNTRMEKRVADRQVEEGKEEAYHGGDSAKVYQLASTLGGKGRGPKRRKLGRLAGD